MTAIIIAVNIFNFKYSTFLGAILGNTKGRFEKVIGYYGVGVPAMSFLGPALGFILLVYLGYQGLFLMLAVLMIVAVMIFMKVRCNNREEFVCTFKISKV